MTIAARAVRYGVCAASAVVAASKRANKVVGVGPLRIAHPLTVDPRRITKTIISISAGDAQADGGSGAALAPRLGGRHGSRIVAVAGGDVRAVPVLDDDDPGVPGYLPGAPVPGHVAPERHHHGPVAHDDDVVPARLRRDPVEDGAGPGGDLDQRLAPAGRTPEPVRLRVVVRARTRRRVGLARELAVRPLPEVRLDDDRDAEALGEDRGSLPGPRERAADDPGRPVQRGDGVRG